MGLIYKNLTCTCTLLREVWKDTSMTNNGMIVLENDDLSERTCAKIVRLILINFACINDNSSQRMISLS